MAIGKKGVLFTIMSILIVAMLLTTNAVIQDTTTETLAQTQTATTRVTTMNSYADTFEAQVRSAVRTAGYFAMKNISKKIYEEGEFLNGEQLNRTFFECVSNDTNFINISNVERGPCIQNRYSIQKQLLSLKSLARDNLAIDTSWIIHDAWITEEEPFELVFWINLSYNLTDPIFAKWNIENTVLKTSVSLEGVPDPTYEYLRSPLMGTTGPPASVEQRNFTKSSNKRHEMNYTLFNDWYDNKTYLTLENLAPSILDRYTGNFMSRSECCGIESVVNRTALTTDSSEYKNYSMADHHFVAHLIGDLGEWNCENSSIRYYTEPVVGGETIVLYWNNYVNIYNLTGATDTSCNNWP